MYYKCNLLLRRPPLSRDQQAARIQIGHLTLDPAAMKVALAEKPVQLTALEFDVLHFLMKNSGVIFTREQLLERIWGNDSYVYDRSIDRQISRLRRKVEDDPNPGFPGRPR